MNAAERIPTEANAASTKFGDVLDHVMQLRKMTQTILSARANISQSYVSKLVASDRDLTEPLAEKFATILGGTQDSWMAVFRETKSNAPRTLAHMVRDVLGEAFPSQSQHNVYAGTPVRQLRKDAILSVFAPENKGEYTHNGTKEDCEIEEFDATFLSMTSYDTRAGYIGIGRHDNGDWIGDPFDESVTIPERTHVFVGTLECFTMPSWLEAEIHPASNIALKPLIVSHGPIIDPLFQGRLFVTVYNPTDKAVQITKTEPFLTLRFWEAE